MKSLNALLLAAAVLAAGCGNSNNLKIDGSSEDSMKKSIEAIIAKLSPEEKKKFQDAVMAVSAKHLLGNMFAEGDKGMQEAMKALHGKTAAEVIAEAEKVRAEMK